MTTSELIDFALGILLGVGGTLLVLKTYFQVSKVEETWTCRVSPNKERECINLHVSEEVSGKSWVVQWFWLNDKPTCWPEAAPKDWSEGIFQAVRKTMKEVQEESNETDR